MRKLTWAAIGVIAIGAVAVAVYLAARGPSDDSPQPVRRASSGASTSMMGDVDRGETSVTSPTQKTNAAGGGSASGGSSAPPLGLQTSKDVPLREVTEPPPDTVALIDAARYTKGSAYRVLFVPYGIGPGGAGSGLVIQVEQSKAEGDVPSPFQFKGRNVLADVSGLPPDEAVKTGGRYEGVITLVERDRVLVPVMSNVNLQLN